MLSQSNHPNQESEQKKMFKLVLEKNAEAYDYADMLRKLATKPKDADLYLSKQHELDQAWLNLTKNENIYSVEQLQTLNKSYITLTAKLNTLLRRALEKRALSNASLASKAYQKLINIYKDDASKLFNYSAEFESLDKLWRYFEKTALSMDELIQINNMTQALVSRLEGELQLAPKFQEGLETKTENLITPCDHPTGKVTNIPVSQVQTTLFPDRSGLPAISNATSNKSEPAASAASADPLSSHVEKETQFGLSS